MFEPIKITDTSIQDTENTDCSRFVIDSKKVNKDLGDFNAGRIPRGYKINIPPLDEHFTFKIKEMLAVVGKKGDGKTTIQMCMQLCSSIVHGLVYVCAFQENKAWSMKMNCLNHLLGDFQDKVEKENPALHQQAVEWFDKHFIFLDVDTMKEATDTVEYLISKGTNVYALILDPVNSFGNGWSDTGNGHTDGVVAGRKILKFASSVCSVYLSQHPNMNGQRQDGPIKSSQAEGGWFLNKADVTWVIHRERGSNENDIIIENVRNKHTGGNETKPDNPVVVHWHPCKIDISYKDGSQAYPDVIGYLVRKHKVFDLPMREFKPEMPNMDITDDIF